MISSSRFKIVLMTSLLLAAALVPQKVEAQQEYNCWGCYNSMFGYRCESGRASGGTSCTELFTEHGWECHLSGDCAMTGPEPAPEKKPVVRGKGAKGQR